MSEAVSEQQGSGDYPSLVTDVVRATPKRVLVLHIEVPGVWVDDLDETAAEYFDGDYLDAVMDEDGLGLAEQVGLTVVVHGDESGPMVHAYTCRVVGAETREARRG